MTDACHSNPTHTPIHPSIHSDHFKVLSYTDLLHEILDRVDCDVELIWIADRF